MKRKIGAGLVLVAIVIAGAGCNSARRATSEHFSSMKPGASRQRGWIGGEFEYLGYGPAPLGMSWAGPMPKPLAKDHRRGVLVTALGSNAPARLAGLREGDVILELNHQALSNDAAFFFNTIDHAEPAGVLPIKAWRGGDVVECNVTVGRETWEPAGMFGFDLIPVVRAPDLWPNPGFSLMVLGYQPWRGKRVEMDNAQNRYLKGNGFEISKPIEKGWYAWLVLFSLERDRRIISQEAVAAPQK